MRVAPGGRQGGFIDGETRLPASVWDSEIGFWEWDPRSDWLTWLNGWPAQCGLPPCDGSGHVVQLRAVMDPDHVERIDAAWLDHVQGRRDRYEVEYRIRALDGAWRWLAMRARIVERDASGAPTRLVGAAFDIDERRRLEIRAEQQRARIDAAAAVVPAWILITDREQRIDYVSRAIGAHAPSALVGVMAASVPGFTATEEFARQHADVLAGQAGSGFRSTDPLTARTFDVRMAPVQVRGHVAGVATSALDVTEHARLEREVVAIEHAQRQRLGADLREGLAQELAGIAYLAATATQRARAEHCSAAELFERVCTLLNESIAHARGLSRGAAPVGREIGGLHRALAELAARSDSRCVVRIEVDRAVAEALSGVAAEHAYAIVHDLLAQADAEHPPVGVRVAVSRRQARALLVVDGLSAALALQPPEPWTRALDLVRYRAEQVSGTLFCALARDGALRVECTFPLDAVDSQSLHPSTPSD